MNRGTGAGRALAPAPRRRPDPHTFQPDPHTPGVCAICPLIKRHEVHDPVKVAAHLAKAHEAQAEERRRAGERD